MSLSDYMARSLRPWHASQGNVVALGQYLVDFCDFNAQDLQRYYAKPAARSKEWLKYMQALTAQMVEVV